MQTKIKAVILGLIIGLSTNFITYFVTQKYQFAGGKEQGIKLGKEEGIAIGRARFEEEFTADMKKNIKNDVIEELVKNRYSKELEATRTQAFSEGRSEGKSDGYNRGKEKGKREAIAQLEELKKKEGSIRNFLNWYEDQLNKLAGEAEQLLEKPDSEKQQIMNEKIKGLIDTVFSARKPLAAAQTALNNQADEMPVALKMNDFKKVNKLIVALRETLPGKRKLVEAELSNLRPK